MSELRSLKRPNFFNGKLITAEDLKLEQHYFREKQKLHNRSLHGFGIVTGLKVIVDSGFIVVEPGLALDCAGNEIAVNQVQSFAPQTIVGAGTLYLHLCFVEMEDDQTPNSEGEEAATIIESFELAFVKENSNRGHRHVRARWLTCGQPHALTIARLRTGAHGWRVDRGYRPPTMK